MTSDPTAPLSPARSPIYGAFGICLLIALYLLPGLLGHDPWRGEDVRHFGAVYDFLLGHWMLLPTLAGEPMAGYGPLYYWISALFAYSLGWLIPLHDAARLGTALFAGLAIFWASRAATLLYGKHTRNAAALLMLGTLGLVVHAHESQPGIALMAAQAITLAGLALMPTQPLKGALQAATGTLMAFLVAGMGGLVLTLPLFLVIAAASPDCRTPRASGALILSLSLAAALSALWLVALAQQAPELLAFWWDTQWDSLGGKPMALATLPRLLELLAWFVWPLWPIALWALWRARAQRWTAPWLLPIAATLLAIGWIVLNGRTSPALMLPIIAPLALLAAGGVPTLRRGAANAFDWFAVMTFSVFGILVWLAWSAQVIAWPPGLARSLARSAPDFVPGNAGLQALIGLLLCAVWLALVIRLPRTPDRGPVNWAMGMTMLWCLTVTLLMPWFDHDRNYRPLAESLSIALAGESSGCVAAMNLGNSHRAAFDYFAGIRTNSVDDNETSCRFLLVREDDFPMNIQPLWQWQQIWEDRHGGGKRLEVFRLYRRD